MANVTREQAKDLLLEFLNLDDANKAPFSQFVTEHATVRGLGDATAQARGYTFVWREAVAAVIHKGEGWEELTLRLGTEEQRERLDRLEKEMKSSLARSRKRRGRDGGQEREVSESATWIESNDEVRLVRRAGDGVACCSADGVWHMDD